MEGPIEMKQGYTKFNKGHVRFVANSPAGDKGTVAAEIAHSVQNPLQFVNNFAALNIELLVELQQAIVSGNREEVEAIIHDVMLNCHRIEEHGKRVAQAIEHLQMKCRC